MLRSLASLLLGCWAFAWLGLGTGGCGSGPSTNQLIDRNGNGLPDSVLVADFDGDGVFEMDDIQDAVDALTDPGPKLVQVVAGSFSPPLSPATRPGRTHALIELRSFTTLRCVGASPTILRGGPLTAGMDYAVVGNDDHTLGNDDVWIQGCEIHGGTTPSYNSTLFPRTRRMGVYFRRTRNSGVSGSFVHDTAHTGLYTSNSSGDQFLNNVVQDVGGYWDTSGIGRQPCIYLFAFGGGKAVSDFRAADNTLRRCGHSGLNTRAEDSDGPGDVVRNFVWERNTVESTHAVCINLRGADGATVRDLSCVRAGSLHLTRGFGSGYRFSGNDNANSNVLLEDIVVSQVDAGQTGIDIGAWVDGLTLRRVRVESLRDAAGISQYRDCAWFERPLRNTLIEDLTIRDCGRSGIVVTSLSGGLGDTSETLTLRRIDIAELDQTDPVDTNFPAGIDFVGGHARLLLEDLTLAGATGPDLRFGGATSLTTVRRIDVDSVDPGWVGAFSEAQVPACSAALEKRWITTLNGTGSTDCVFTAGTTGSIPARCACTSGAWNPIFWSASSGIDFATGVTHANVLLEDVTVKNARGVTGVRVRGSLSAFSIDTILGADDSFATDVDQRSAADFDAASGFTVSGATCIGTQPAVPCIE